MCRFARVYVSACRRLRVCVYVRGSVDLLTCMFEYVPGCVCMGEIGRASCRGRV